MDLKDEHFSSETRRKNPKKFNNGNHNLTINICASFYDFFRYLFGLAADAAAAAVQFSSNSFLFFSLWNCNSTRTHFVWSGMHTLFGRMLMQCTMEGHVNEGARSQHTNA